MKCKKIRVNDEWQCSCGLEWDVNESDPHGKTYRRLRNETMRHIRKKLSRKQSLRRIAQIRQRLM